MIHGASVALLERLDGGHVAWAEALPPVTKRGSERYDDNPGVAFPVNQHTAVVGITSWLAPSFRASVGRGPRSQRLKKAPFIFVHFVEKATRGSSCDYRSQLNGILLDLP